MNYAATETRKRTTLTALLMAVLALAFAVLTAATVAATPTAAWADTDKADGIVVGSTTDDLSWYPKDPSTFEAFHSSKAPRVVDNADLLSDQEEADLLDHINEMRDRLNMDFVLVTENSSYGLSHKQFSADFYAFNGYGVGPDYTGVIYFVCMEPGNRGFWTSACGSAQKLMTEDNVNYMDDATYDFFKAGDYARAINTQFDNLDLLYTEGGFPEDPIPFGGAGVLAVIVGLVTGSSTLKQKRKAMQTVAPANYASRYVAKGPVFSVNSDVQTGHNITRIPHVDPESSSGGGGGSSYSSGYSSSGGSSSHSFSGGGRSF